MATLPVNKIHKAVDDGKSMDAIVGMFADKRTTNTDDIRKIVKDYKFKTRIKKEDKDVTQGYMDHMKKVNKGEVNKYPMRGKGTPLSQERKDALFGKKKDKVDKVDEVAGPDKCWDGYKPGNPKTKAGTGKNAGKRVNNCVPV